MKFAGTLLALVLCAVPSLAGTPGMFRGVVGEVADRGPNWIYVEGRNGMIRVVDISGAQVVYAANFPPQQRRRAAANSIMRGAEVRVLAEQDEKSGDWRATEIEILRPGPGRHSQPESQ